MNEGETNEKQEDNEEDEEEADKKMNFDDKEGLPKVVKAIIPEQSQHGIVHDETSQDEIEKLTRSLRNTKDRAMLMSEMEDSKTLLVVLDLQNVTWLLMNKQKLVRRPWL